MTQSPSKTQRLALRKRIAPRMRLPPSLQFTGAVDAVSGQPKLEQVCPKLSGRHQPPAPLAHAGAGARSLFGDSSMSKIWSKRLRSVLGVCGQVVAVTGAAWYRLTAAHPGPTDAASAYAAIEPQGACDRLPGPPHRDVRRVGHLGVSEAPSRRRLQPYLSLLELTLLSVPSCAATADSTVSRSTVLRVRSRLVNTSADQRYRRPLNATSHRVQPATNSRSLRRAAPTTSIGDLS
jgi:hypothetical protein